MIILSKIMLLRFSIDGPGEIVITDNGDATSHEPFQQNERAAFNGMALAIVRASKLPFDKPLPIPE